VNASGPHGLHSDRERVAKHADGRAPPEPALWWAHLEFIPINIKLTILRKKIEDLRGAAVMSSAGDVQEVSLPQSMFIAR
jgi:hypothetical protein